MWWIAAAPPRRPRAHLVTVLETGGWKPPEPAARMAALRSVGVPACGFWHLPDASYSSCPGQFTKPYSCRRHLTQRRKDARRKSLKAFAAGLGFHRLVNANCRPARLAFAVLTLRLGTFAPLR